MNPVIEQIKAEALPDVCETILTWGDNSFDTMMDVAEFEEFEYKHYDTTSMLVPGTARWIEEDVWLIGYRFIIAVSFEDENDVEVHTDSKQCFLALDSAKNINHWFDETQIDTFIATGELH